MTKKTDPEQKKFIFTGMEKIVQGKTVYQIQAIRDIRNRHGVVKNGDLGGWIEEENCILWKSEAWVFPNCTVFGNGTIIQPDTNTKNVEFFNSPRYTIVARPYNILYKIMPSGKVEITVGCQNHFLETWKSSYEKIAKWNGFPSEKISEFLEHLATIEKLTTKVPATNLEILEDVIKISKNLQEKFSKDDIESAKKLLESLSEPVAEVPAVPAASKGPLRDASGRFAKKS